MTHIDEWKRLTPIAAGLLAIFLAACTLPVGPVTRLLNAPAPTTVPLAVTAAPAVGGAIAPTEHPIALPPGFVISVFAQGLDDPRMLAIGPDGALYAAERGAGRILRLPDGDGDGLADAQQVVAQGLEAPSSLAFYRDGSLYVAETTRIVRLSEPDAQGTFQRQEMVVDGLPSGGHSTRTVLFSPDYATLFVSIGSSCNVCVEEDPRRAAIMAYNPDGGNARLYARGLRNAVGITFRPGTDELWASNNGRDLLGDDLPPETINLVQEGDDFGWPRCHAGRIVDLKYGGPQGCRGVKDPAVEMQAHSAPLGLAFYSGSQFPQEYRGDLFVAFHGSWNRSVPTGYKLVRIPMQESRPGPVQDFASGWLLANGSSWGRPVDVITGGDGSLYVSDDAGGKIYRIFYTGS
jgi:glucose/arabinose dehydrogenase